jgi:hypothetical protein
MPALGRQGSASSFISYSTVASSLVNIKSVTVAMWINTNPILVGRNPCSCYQKQLILGNIFTFVEGTGPANTMVLKNHVQKM